MRPPEKVFDNRNVFEKVGDVLSDDEQDELFGAIARSAEFFRNNATREYARQIYSEHEYKDAPENPYIDEKYRALVRCGNLFFTRLDSWKVVKAGKVLREWCKNNTVTRCY